MHGLALHACERCACACGEGSREHWRGVRRAQQWAVARAAGVCGRRAAGARCAVGRTGQHTTARGATSTWRFERGSGRLNSKFKGPSFKASAQLSNPPNSPAPGAAVCSRPAHGTARACCAPAAQTCCALPRALCPARTWPASLGSVRRTRTRTDFGRHAAHALGRDALTCSVGEPVKARLPLSLQPRASHRLACPH